MFSLFECFLITFLTVKKISVMIMIYNLHGNDVRKTKENKRNK